MSLRSPGLIRRDLRTFKRGLGLRAVRKRLSGDVVYVADVATVAAFRRLIDDVEPLMIELSHSAEALKVSNTALELSADTLDAARRELRKSWPLPRLEDHDELAGILGIRETCRDELIGIGGARYYCNRWVRHDLPHTDGHGCEWRPGEKETPCPG